MQRPLRLVVGNALVFAACLLVVEAGGQIYALLHPGYRVLAWEPHPVLGWKLVPALKATWTGDLWYAKEFSVPIETNSHGFRDVERAEEKPSSVLRIAVLGDSYVEALQVPIERTATRLLERRLNAARPQSRSARHYEVLNFGVSNYSVGQYLLAWEQEVRRFSPDLVFVFVGALHFGRTVSRYEEGAFPKTRQERLWIRPTFALVDGILVREPARDYEKFRSLQAETIATEFRGRRLVRQTPQSFTTQLGTALVSGLGSRFRPVRRKSVVDEAGPGGDVITVNVRLLGELATAVERDGAFLVIVEPFADGAVHEQAIREVCASHGCGHLPLGKELLETERQGTPTRWRQDGHFNERGNAIFADAMYGYVRADAPTSPRKSW